MSGHFYSQAKLDRLVSSFSTGWAPPQQRPDTTNLNFVTATYDAWNILILLLTASTYGSPVGHGNFNTLECVQNDHDMTMQVEKPEQIGTQSSDFHYVQNFRKPMLIQ